MDDFGRSFGRNLAIICDATVPTLPLQSLVALTRTDLVGMGFCRCNSNPASRGRPEKVTGLETYSISGVAECASGTTKAPVTAAARDGSTKTFLAGDRAHRYAHRSGPLSERRHSAVRAAQSLIIRQHRIRIDVPALKNLITRLSVSPMKVRIHAAHLGDGEDQTAREEEGHQDTDDEYDCVRHTSSSRLLSGHRYPLQ